MSAHRRAQAGQVLPLFGIFLVVLFGMAALVIDGGFMLESKSDLQTVAQHAADSGAQMIDVSAYDSGCVNRLSDPLCQSSLRLAAGTASARAGAVAAQWLNSIDTATLRLPSVAPSGGGISASASGDTITVTVTRCYRPYLADVILGMVSSGSGCPSGTIAISATATATAAEGY